MNQNKIVNLLNRVLKSNGTKLKKLDEYMYWSPFVSQDKPKYECVKDILNMRAQQHSNKNIMNNIINGINKKSS